MHISGVLTFLILVINEEKNLFFVIFQLHGSVAKIITIYYWQALTPLPLKSVPLKDAKTFLTDRGPEEMV